jgi:hypothetical protein
MSRTTTKVLALTAASGLAVVGFFLTKPAFAGTNGQQLQICQQQSEDYQTMRLEGFNQDGDVVGGTFGIAPGGCGSTPGYYWVGNVSVELTQSENGAPNRSASCDVPKEQEFEDLTTCFL